MADCVFLYFHEHHLHSINVPTRFGLILRSRKTPPKNLSYFQGLSPNALFSLFFIELGRAPPEPTTVGTAERWLGQNRARLWIRTKSVNDDFLRRTGRRTSIQSKRIVPSVQFRSEKKTIQRKDDLMYFNRPSAFADNCPNLFPDGSMKLSRVDFQEENLSASSSALSRSRTTTKFPSELTDEQ